MSWGAILKKVGVALGKQALQNMLPVVGQVVAEVEQKKMSGRLKRNRAELLIEREAKKRGVELAPATRNLMIELAVNAQRESESE